MTRRHSLFALFLLVSFVLSCTDTLVQEETPPSEPILRGTLRVADSSRTPDSITWNWNGRKGKALLACSEGICKFQASLGNIGSSDTVSCGFWTLGLRTMQGTARLDASGDLSVDLKSIRIDTAVKILLGFHDSLRKVDESRYPWTYGGLLDAYAVAILNGNAKVLGGYPKSWPGGFDTTGLVKRVVKLAIDGQGSLEQISATWNVPLTAIQAKSLVLELLKERSTGKDDSLRLFPPSSLKFVQLVTLGKVLWPGGDTVKLAGRVESDSSLSRVSIQILKGESVVTDRFVMDTAPPVSGKTWDLAGKLHIYAKTGTELGSYTMAIQVWDLRQSRILHTVPFKVETRPDAEGPQIQFLSPSQIDVIEPKDSITRVSLKGVDPSGIDSITVQGRRAKVSGDTLWLDVSTPLKSNSFNFLVTAWDKQGNRSDSILQLRRRETRDTLQFALVLPTQQTANILGVDSAFLRVKYFARSPYGISDTGLRINRAVARRGLAPNDTDSWYQDVPVLASGEVVTVPVILTDKRGGQVSHFIEVTRIKDTIGPFVKRISPTLDTSVDFNSPLVEIRVEVTDPSGLDSIRIQGRQAERLAGGRYFALVPVEPTGKPTAIHVVAVDGRKNRTDSVINVTRSATKDVIQLAQPARKISNLVAEWVDTFRVTWKLPKDSVKYKVESPSGDTFVNLGGGMWTTLAHLDRGKLRVISIRITDSVGGGNQVSDYVEVTRSDVLPAPVVKLGNRLDTLGGDTLGTRDSSLNLMWNLAAPCTGCTFEIDGKPVKPGSGADSLVVGMKTNIAWGTDVHSFVISKGGVVLLRKDYRIRRFTAPKIEFLSPASGLVKSDEKSTEVAWHVRGGTHVWIDGVDQGGTGEGIYRVTITKPDSSMRVVRLVVADSGRGKDSANREIQWTVPITFFIDPVSSASSQWDSVPMRLNSPITSTPVAFRWEADQGRKGTAKSGELVSLLSNGQLKVCASAAGYLEKCDSSATFGVQHTNQAPSFERPSKVDTVFVDEDFAHGDLHIARNLRKGSKWDSAQILSFQLKSLAHPGFYADGPRVDLQTGILSFVPAADSFGVDSIEIKLCDDGGTDHGGKDCSAPQIVKVVIRAVNDAPIALPWTIEVPISDSMVKVTMDPVSSGPGEPFVAGMNFQASLKSAGNAKPGSLAVARGASKDTVKIVPGVLSGVPQYQVVATDIPGPNVLGVSLSDTFNLSVKVVNSWPAGSSSLPLAVAFGRTWFTQSRSDSGESDSVGVATNAFKCPSGWVLPDTNDVQKMTGIDSAVIASIGLTGGESLWTKTGGVVRMAKVAIVSKRGAITLPVADRNKAILRCVYGKN